MTAGVALWSYYTSYIQHTFGSARVKFVQTVFSQEDRLASPIEDTTLGAQVEALGLWTVVQLRVWRLEGTLRLHVFCVWW